MLANKWLYLIIGFVTGIIIGVLSIHKDLSSGGVPAPAPNNIIMEETALSVKPKVQPNAPDLVVTSQYVAQINGEKVTAPIRTTKDNSTASINTTIDVTPLLQQMQPKWELGVGVGYDNLNKEINYPIALQKNYKADKAIELVIVLNDKSKAEKAYLMHKWLIK